MPDANKIAIVTGASAGIGRAAAIALGKNGWTVVLTARDENKLQETATRIPSCLVVPGDLTDSAFVERLFSETVDKYGRIDLFFNNAGMNIGAKSLEDIDLADFERMKKQSPQGGRIINNGSISAHVPRPGSAGYTASKHGISGLTKTAALDGRKYNIAVSQIDIGNAATDMAQKNYNGAPQANGEIMQEPLFDVEHVASSIVYMASLPLSVNVLSHTIMATNMPSMVGRG